jgi:hypothetical protein
VLRGLNDMTRWPILILTSDVVTDENPDEAVIPHSYIIFLWPQQDESIYETFALQIQNQKDNPSWNPRAKFLVVVHAHDTETHMSVPSHVCKILWELGTISNLVVLIPSSDKPVTINYISRMQMEEIKTFDLYTFFPYTTKNCGKVTDVILIDKWLLQKKGRFDRDADLFPPKIPDDFMGCPIRVSTIGFEPFVVITHNHTQEGGNIVYNVRGLLVENFLVSMAKMNISVAFLAPEVEISIASFMKALGDQVEGLSDILIGFVPILPMAILPGFVHTIPVTGSLFSFFLPCPSRVHKMSKLFSIFTLPVWLSLALAFVLTSATFWCLENKSHVSNSRKPCTATSFSLPIYNAWAILMAVSVPKMPNTWTHRILFLVYVCFSFAMVTVFQTFFVSYLVEPGYGKAITTLQEALESGLLQAHHPFIRHFWDALDFEDYNVDVPDSRRVTCVDLVECTKRMVTQRDIVLMNAELYVRYIASSVGVVDYTKVICHVEYSSIYVYAAGLLHKGSPFLDGLNKFMSRYLEGGLIGKYSADTHFRAHLQSMGSKELVEDTTAEFFVFTIHHLSAAFVILILGHIVSCIVFICEVINKRVPK